MSVLTVTLAGVTPNEVTLLQDAGILNDVDLGTLSVTNLTSYYLRPKIAFTN
jgi:hypothetical protein